MNHLEHQSSKTEIQVRINGNPKWVSQSINGECLQVYAAMCKEHPRDYVDIVSVRTEIVLNQYNYNEFKKHFNQSATAD